MMRLMDETAATVDARAEELREQKIACIYAADRVARCPGWPRMTRHRPDDHARSAYR